MMNHFRVLFIAFGLIAAAAAADQLLPVVANTPGAGGSFWKNDTSVANPYDEAVEGRLVFFAAGTSGDIATAPFLTLTLGPHQAMCLENPLEEMGLQGFGAMTFVSPRPLVFTSRTYNAVGGMEFGQGMRGMLKGDFLRAGDKASFVTVKNNDDYRYNFGVYSEDASQIQFELYSNGNLVSSVVKDFPSRYLIQQDVNSFFGTEVPANTAIIAKVLSGKALMYGSGVHNFTGDGGMQEQNVFERTVDTGRPVDMDLCYFPETIGNILTENADEFGETLVGGYYYDDKKDKDHVYPISPDKKGWAKLLKELVDTHKHNYETYEIYVLDNFNNKIAFADAFDLYYGQDLEIRNLTQAHIDAFNDVLYSYLPADAKISRAEDKTILPVVANTPGAQGSLWKTDLQLVNPFDTEISGKIMFFPSGASGSEEQTGLEFTLAPKQVQLYDNFLSLIGVEGFGAAKVVMTNGKAPKIAARTYNAIDGKELSQGMNDFLLEDLLVAGENAYLVTVKDTTDFRFNIGAYAEEESLVDFKVEDENGQVVAEVQKYFPARFHTQAAVDQFFSAYVPKNSKITASVVSGKVKVYGSGVHNQTGDGYYQDAVVLTEKNTPSSIYKLNKVYPHDKEVSGGMKFWQIMHDHAREFAEILSREHINVIKCGDTSIWVHYDIDTWENEIKLMFDNDYSFMYECQHKVISEQQNMVMFADVFVGLQYGQNRCTFGATESDVQDYVNILKKYL